MTRYMPLILLALFIDGLQALLSVGFFTMGAGISAATLGAAAVVAVPVGIGLGFLTDVCVSVTFGAGLLFLLKYNDMFYPAYAFGGGLGELIPGLDILPGWTAMTVLSAIRKSREENEAEGSSLFSSALSVSALVAAPEVAVAARARTVGNVSRNVVPQHEPEVREALQRRERTQLKDVDIRAPRVLEHA